MLRRSSSPYDNIFKYWFQNVRKQTRQELFDEVLRAKSSSSFRKFVFSCEKQECALTIQSTRYPQDDGEYSCLTKNRYQQLFKKIDVTILGKLLHPHNRDFKAT